MSIRIFTLLVACLSIFLTCANISPTDSDSLQYGIDISGKVLDKDGKPMANAIAHLPGYDLYDTTGTDGNYRLTMSGEEINKLAKSAAVSKDSLEIKKSGQIITILELPSLICNMGDIFVLQRNIYGKIDSVSTSFKRVEAVLTYLLHNINSKIRQEVTKL